MKIVYTLLALALSLNIATSQHDHSKCGMTTEDQASLVAFQEYFNKNKANMNLPQRDDKLYVPVKFHVVSKSDGTGGVSPVAVFDQFERLRVDFAPNDMVLYLADNSFNYLSNSTIYLNPGSAFGTVENAKDENAINIFITENADSGNGLGTVLGFYSPGSDFIIIRINDVTGPTSSLSHELGHLFSLPHTFFGWESVPYDENIHGNPVELTVTPGAGAQIELVNGTNCLGAADRICDTPPDYNFGFGANDCAWDREILDRNGDLIEPMFDNYMGYFLGCDAYRWTEGQKDAMRANWSLDSYNGNDRSFLRSSYVPTTDSVDHDYALIEPAKNSTSQFSDYVLIDWDDAEGASAYQIELTLINPNNGSQEIILEVVTESEFELTQASGGEFVNFAVKAFNESYGGAPTLRTTFFVGQGSVATDDLADIFTQLIVSPNPLSTGQELNIRLKSEKSTDALVKVTDITGKAVYSQQHTLNSGANNLQVETLGFTSGIYLVKIESELGSIYKKVIME